ncbi:MAG: choice-of-anchor V domain-containing protein [Pseudomonadota bacterium]
MKRLAGLIALFVFAAAPFPSGAFPDGAPWGSADPSGAQNCASCHFDSEAVLSSDALFFLGSVPEKILAGEAYSFGVASLADINSVVGFLLAATCEGEPCGVFLPGESGQEVNGSQIRSTELQTPFSKGGASGIASWIVQWRAPIDLTSPVDFHFAVNIANDDQSPLGDQIHYRSHTIPME